MGIQGFLLYTCISVNINIFQDDFAYRNNVMNAEKSIRLAFVRKVYGLLTVQLLTTVAIAAVLTLVEPVQGFIHKK